MFRKIITVNLGFQRDLLSSAELSRSLELGRGNAGAVTITNVVIISVVNIAGITPAAAAKVCYNYQDNQYENVRITTITIAAFVSSTATISSTSLATITTTNITTTTSTTTATIISGTTTTPTTRTPFSTAPVALGVL